MLSFKAVVVYMVVWWVSVVVIISLLGSNDAISSNTVFRVAIMLMGLFFVCNMGLMMWPAIKEAHSGGTSLWQILMKVMLVLVLALLPMLGGLGVFLFLVFFIISSLLPNSLSRFLKLQAILPTSKIRSLAMGLVELQGKIIARERVEAPLSRRQCIGYYYCVHRESRDKDGKISWRLVSDERRCNDFTFEDETGEVQVSGESLDLHLLEKSKETFSGWERYQEYRLDAGGKYLLIGQATRRGRNVVIVRDKLRRVFGIAPVGNVARRSKLNGLMLTAGIYAAATALMVALVLTLPVKSWGQRVWIDYAAWPPYQMIIGIFQ